MSPILKLITVFCILSGEWSFCCAQDISTDSSSIATLKEWLKKSWISDQLQVKEVESKNRSITIQLQISDSLAFRESWKSIKNAFESQSSTTFEIYIFQKCAFLLDVRPADLRLIIANKPITYERPCFSRVITFSAGVAVVRQDCRDAIVRTQMAYDKFKASLSLKRFSQETIDGSLQKILNLIYDGCQSYYSKKYPHSALYRVLQDDNSVVFRVENLTNEVISDSWARPGTTERLEFRVDCSPAGKVVHFTITLNGKFRATYLSRTEHDMDIEFRAALQQYTERFTDQHVIAWLKN